MKPLYWQRPSELIVHDNGEHRAVVVQMPFYDPLRMRTHPATDLPEVYNWPEASFRPFFSFILR